MRIAARREKRRLARRGKHYHGIDLDDLLSKHHPRPNPAYRQPKRHKLRGKRFIDIPARLDCVTDADWSLLAGVLNTIRDISLRGGYRRVILNFYDVVSMAPAAAVALVAEIQRCREFCDRRTDITGTYPNSHDVAALLCDVGFFKALDIREPPRPKAFDRKTYVQISRKNSNVPEFADELLACFEEVFEFDPADRRRLYVALLESMDNVFEHAYPTDSKAPHFIREWWLLGLGDRDQRTISFTFYDQGAGIPATIRGRQPDRIRNVLGRWSDGQWIKRAVEKGVSRHQSRRRGHGLQKLREFIQELDVNGSLRVVANQGLAEFSSSGHVTVGAITEELNGTLVVWQIRDVDVNVPQDSDGALPHAA
ncbi:ATP-binding protein [Lysobacter sp. Root494]|uniref:ATP-binding protein n=1 Tax=Lysobacter sp. Root494 TaxID=1736549 RepID=UPI0007160C95|nr:ATP-binding protein [Lysobacter sp. Root494]KQY51180.1 hypothetical protein ASD14_10275 [Lysobacter sp. Root494]